MKSIAFLSLLILPMAAAAQPTPRLGTLFYSPTERTAVALARTGAQPEAPPTETPVNFEVTGLVKREGGKGTIWLNKKPYEESRISTQLIDATPKKGGVEIQGKLVRVREKFNANSGEKSDYLPAGTLGIRKAK